MKSSLRAALITLGVLSALILGSWLTLTWLRPYRYHGLELQTPKPAADFTLTGGDGRPVSLSAYRGKVVALYFGYTFCPDVCPTTLADLARALKKLGPRAAEVQVIMVTVDPERDTPTRLAEYVTYFNPSFIGLSGTPDQIAAAATLYGIYYQKHEGTPASGYLVDHTATITALDREGRVKLMWTFGTTSDDIAADLDHMLR